MHPPLRLALRTFGRKLSFLLLGIVFFNLNLILTRKSYYSYLLYAAYRHLAC